MALSLQTHRVIATALWVTFGVLLGLTVGVYLGVEPRTQVFMVALGGGLVLLVRANLTRPSQQPDQVLQLPAPTEVPGDISLEHNTVEELLAHPGQLEGDQARDWLDRFLVEQQQK